jgi:hypothetical protein
MLTAKDFEPEEGWWKVDTEEAINDVIRSLRDAGYEDDNIEWVIYTLELAFRNEYGE